MDGGESGSKRGLPRMAVILAKGAIESGLGESRGIALDELAPLLEEDATAMEFGAGTRQSKS